MRLQVEIATASRTSRARSSSRRKRSASRSVSARRSRSATGAVLCEMPSAAARSSPRGLLGSVRGARRALPRRLGELVELGELALDARELDAMIAT